jgi:hypothetical protein
VGVAQLVELLVVVQAVVGSSPIAHPVKKSRFAGLFDAVLRLPVTGCRRLYQFGVRKPILGADRSVRLEVRDLQDDCKRLKHWPRPGGD